MLLTPCGRAPLLFFLALAPLIARDKTDWTNVKTIPAETDVRVKLKTNSSVRGEFRNSTDAALIIARTAAEESLDRANIATVEYKTPSHRWRNALIGTGIGAAGGLAVGAVTDQESCPTGNCFGLKNIGKVVLTPAGALIGFLVGLAIPTGRWHEVYRAP
jgi:hypothetical protein